MTKLLAAAAALVGLLGQSLGALAADKEITIGYQLIYSPWHVAIADSRFEKATGWQINWRQFDSGAKVVTAMDNGEVQIALAGSSPIAAGISRGIPIELFWIVNDIASAEALVARDGAGIVAPQDLKGKKIAVPFVSTTHFHTLFALEQFGIDTSEVEVLNMQPPRIAEAWSAGQIDAAFVWDPVLGFIKQSGDVLITSGQLSAWGKATFDGMVALRDFSAANPEFMAAFVSVLAEADEVYRSNAETWTSDTPEVKAIAELVGGNPDNVPAVLALYGFPALAEQVSCRWLGCGKDGGAARALLFTSEFLRDQGKIDGVLPEYSRFVNPAFVEAAREMKE